MCLLLFGCDSAAWFIAFIEIIHSHNTVYLVSHDL